MFLSDTELIKKSQNGDTAAFEELVYRYDRRILSVALKYFGDTDDAKDMYQEVLIRAYKGMKNFRFESEFSTWLYRIATNVCLTAKMRSKKHLFASINEDIDSDKHFDIPATDPGDQPESRLHDTEVSQKLNSALGNLPPKMRMSFVLKHLEGYKIREIAEMMDCKEGTVKKYLFDGVRKLREELKEFSF